MGDVVHHAFNAQHSLRTAKATERGGGLHVGFQAIGCDGRVRQKIGVV